MLDVNLKLVSSLTLAMLILFRSFFAFRKKVRTEERERKFFESRRFPPFDQVIRLARLHGNNSSSFLGLYPGFKYFQSADPSLVGAIAFLSADTAWIGASVPLASPADQMALLKEFAETAGFLGKSVFLLPVDAEFAERAKQVGYGNLQIGVEPTFTSADMGGKKSPCQSCVTEFKVADLSVQHKAQLDEILQEWVDSRKMPLLSFLNRVEPWTLPLEKRYFQFQQRGKIFAFVAAVPIWPRNGWYLIDVVKRSSSPTGTTDILIQETMKLLNDQGAKEATLGVAPFAGLEDKNNGKSPSIWNLAGLARLIYRNLGFFYNFKSLYQFKLKFKPTRTVPQFMIYYPSPPRWRGIKAVIEAFVPNGLLNTLALTFLKAWKRLNLDRCLKKQISNRIVVRSAPPSWQDFLWRCRFTIALCFCYFFYQFLDFYHVTPPNLKPAPMSSHVEIMSVGIALVCGLLEYLAGMAILALSLLPSVGLLFFALKKFDLVIHALSVESIGIIACGAAVAEFLRHRYKVLAGLVVVVVGVALVYGDWMALFGLLAVAFGLAGVSVGLRVRY